jgi:hypothetical protein
MSKSRMAGLFQTSAGNLRFGGPLPTIMAVGPKGYTDHPSLAQERASNRKYARTTDGANAPPMSRAIEARARTQPVRQIRVGQKLAANGNQIRTHASQQLRVLFDHLVGARNTVGLSRRSPWRF